MNPSRLVRGVLFLAVTVVAWGATFPIAKLALAHVDGYWLTAIRYACLAPIFVALLWLVEGGQSFGYGGRFLAAALVGTLGYAGFNLLSYIGLGHTRADHAAIINTLQAPMTALAHWLWRGVRPARFTLGCIAAAILGVVLVVTKGDPAQALEGGSLYGDLLCLLGGACWVAYVLGVVKFADWSSLRYTALTSMPGTLAILAITAVATLAGVAHVPGADALRAAAWPTVYLVLATGVAGVLAWNRGIQLLGPLNAVLIGSLIPVVTFAITGLQGTRFTAIEIAGALLVLAALAANNLFLRRRLGKSTG